MDNDWYVLFVNENGSFDIVWMNGEEENNFEVTGILNGQLVFTKVIE